MRNIYLKIKKMLINIYKMDKTNEMKTLISNYEELLLGNNEQEDLAEEEEIIISLTTYGKRIFDVHLAIESLFRQTKKPDKIILWLAKEEFNSETIPLILKKQIKKGLQIKYCEDLKSYKKLLPALKEFSKSIIITADDDILYPYDMVENLYKTYKKNMKEVVCYRGSRYKISKNNKLAPYKTWKSIEKESKGKIFLTTGGGTLFFPGCFDDEIFNLKKIFELCPTADDVWVNAMLLKNGTEIKKVEDPRNWDKRFFILEENQDTGLFQINIFEGKNDKQLNKVFSHYNLWEKIVNA